MGSSKERKSAVEPTVFRAIRDLIRHANDHMNDEDPIYGAIRIATSYLVEETKKDPTLNNEI